MASGGKLVVLAALGGNVAIAVTKFAAALIAGSSSMLTEGIHSTVDCGDQLLMLYGRHRANQPPDRQHPLGHGRELYFWAFVVALLIFTGGACFSIYEGINHIRHPEMLTQPWINYAVLAASFVFEGISISFAIREFRRTKNPNQGWFAAIRASKDPTVFLVLMEDAAALIGLVVAAGAISLTLLTRNPLWDGAGSIGIGLILATVAAILGYECKELLIGERARPELHDRVRRVVESHSRVCRVNEVIAINLGPEDVIVTISLDFDHDLTIGDAERIIDELEEQVKEACSDINRVFVRPKSVGAARKEHAALTG